MIVSIVQFIVIAICLLIGIFLFSFLRKKYQSKVEIAIIDVIAIAFIVSICLLLTGKITSFKVASLEIEAAKENALEAIKKEVEKQREISSLWVKVITDQDISAVLDYLDELEKREPEYWLVYDYRGSIYYAKAQTVERFDENRDKKVKDLLLRAKEAYAKSYSLHKGVSVTEIIKICAELDEEDETKKWIETGITDKTLEYSDLFKISEIYKYNSKEWFKGLIEKAKQKK